MIFQNLVFLIEPTFQEEGKIIDMKAIYHPSKIKFL